MSHMPQPAPEVIAALCRSWQIARMSLVGSVLRSDFGPQSDVDVVLEFLPTAQWDLFDMVRLRDELTRLYGLPVPLIEESAVRNPYMLESIRRTKRVVYAA